MLKQIVAHNFRTHEKLEVDLHPGVNVFVGITDSGKTNIIRLIEWVRTNRPMSDRVHSDFNDGDTSVELIFDDCHVKLLRERGATPVYYVNGEKYKALRGNVPAEVTEALRLGEINIHEQGERQFLITESAGEAARIVSRITRIEKVDEWAGLITSLINTKNKETKILASQLEEKKTELDTLKEAEGFDRSLLGVEKLFNELCEIDAEIESLFSLAEKYKDCSDGMPDLTIIKKAEKELVEVKELDERYGSVQANHSELIASTHSLRRAEEALSESGNDMMHALADFRSFLKSLKGGCPFCKFCETPARGHSLDELLREFE